MKRSTLMRTVKRLAVAGVAAALSVSLPAAVTLTAPADYATVNPKDPLFAGFNTASSTYDWQTFAESTRGNEERTAMMNAYRASGRVELAWSGSGTWTVTIRRVKDSAVVFTTTTSGNSTVFYNPEIGRNYEWTVASGAQAATGHFYVSSECPRILNYAASGSVDNLRDLGGWPAADGKVVRQGLLFRSREFDWFSPTYKDGPGLPYLRETIGIGLDLDLRTKDTVINEYISDYGGSLEVSPIGGGVPRYMSRMSCAYDFKDYASLISTVDGKVAFYHDFTNTLAYVRQGKAVIFHCSHGKDRTGSYAYVLNGLLGVALQDLGWITSTPGRRCRASTSRPSASTA